MYIIRYQWGFALRCATKRGDSFLETTLSNEYNQSHLCRFHIQPQLSLNLLSLFLTPRNYRKLTELIRISCSRSSTIADFLQRQVNGFKDRSCGMYYNHWRSEVTSKGNKKVRVILKILKLYKVLTWFLKIYKQLNKL